MQRPFQHRANARSVKALVTLLGVWLVLVGLYIGLNASPIWIGLGAALSLPAAWEFAIAKPAGLRLDDTALSWFSGRYENAVPLDEIDHVRFDTRLDLSQRVSVVTRSGKKLRLTQDSLPAPADLKAALTQRGIRSAQHHFALFG